MESGPYTVPGLTGRQRLKAHLWALFRDNGFAREFLWHNFHRVSARAYRSAQPSVRHLRKWLPRHGIRTVVNLRGYRPPCPHLDLEADTCHRLGASLVHFKMLSRDLPDPERLLEARRLLVDLDYPVLFHCTSGSDRAGLMSALYLHWIEDVPVAQAARQLRFWPYRHVRYAKTGMLDHFLESYLADTAGSPQALDDWIRTRYDRGALKKAFRSRGLADLLVDRILRRE